MKTDFSVTIQVNIGVTPEVVQLVTAILTKQAPASQEPNKELTEEDVREAMNRARCRIEGEDWKDNTDGDLYKKYHRQLNATFKNISDLLGADKPSALPADKRADFIAECDLLIVNDKGEISKPDAF